MSDTPRMARNQNLMASRIRVELNTTKQEKRNEMQKKRNQSQIDSQHKYHQREFFQQLIVAQTEIPTQTLA